MLAGVSPVYVDRFARAWHRLSTADAPEPHTIISEFCEKINPCLTFMCAASGHDAPKRTLKQLAYVKPRDSVNRVVAFAAELCYTGPG